MTCRDQVKLFVELFPNLVIEKWFSRPNGGVPYIRVATTNHEYYAFKAISRDNWILHRCILGFKDDDF